MAVFPRRAPFSLVALLALAACDQATASARPDDGAAAPAPAAATQRPGWKKLGPGANLATTFAAEAAEAKRSGLRPVAYLGASWCPPCHALQAHREHALMKGALAGVQVIELDVDEWSAEELATVGIRFQAIPAFFRLDDKGHADGRAIDGGAWGEDIPENFAPVLKRFFAE